MVKYFVFLTFFVAITIATPVPKPEAKASYENYGYTQPIGLGTNQFPSIPITQPLTYSPINVPSVPIGQYQQVSPPISGHLNYNPSPITSYLQPNVPYVGSVGGQYIPSTPNVFPSGSIQTVPNFGGYVSNQAEYNPIQTIGHV